MMDVVPLVVAGSVLGGAVGLALAVVAWRHREVPAALPFGGLLLVTAVWSFANAAFLTADTANGVYVADRIVRAAGAQVPALWFVFVLSYCGFEEWINAKTVTLLWLYPLSYVLISVTAPLHGLTSTPDDVVVLTTTGITAPYVPPDLLVHAFLLLSYATIALGYVILVSFLVRSRAVYQTQTGIVLAGTLVPVVANVFVQLEGVAHPGLDVTPITFILTGLAVGWALVRYDFLTVTPMAQDVLIDELPDPVFVLGEDDRIVDFNPAAAEAFGHGDLADRSIEDVASGLVAHLEDGRIFRHRDDRRADGGGSSYYEPSVTTLEDQYGTARSRLVVLRDVTGQQRRQERLEALQEATRQFLAASTDHEIAEIATTYAEQTLDGEAAGVLLADDDGVLRPAATNEAAAAAFDRANLVAGPDDASEAYRAYETGEPIEADIAPDVGGPMARVVLLPMGDHGVLGVAATDRDAFGPDDEGFAEILARTTQVALTRIERERELRRSRAALERRTEQLAFFNGVLRHSLRNALLVIEGRAEYLRGSVGAGDGEHLDTIVRWCADLSALAEEIRSVNDTVTASESERLGRVDLSSLLSDRLDAYVERYPDATFDLDVDDGLEIMANDLARSVVDSIVDNAVVHNGSGTPHVELWTVEAADRVQLHVADDGPGMTDEMKSIVFERAVTTNQTASGFGLHFVSVLMNLYGGTLLFEDNDPRGTVAVLEFKLAGTDGGVTDSKDPDRADSEDADRAGSEYPDTADPVDSTEDGEA